ncbi:uncharacterized protein LOC114844880 isoform X2 [Betta splendens]|uniref:Uncharacterized protein LOC114844880 isoform X2 n=1 Tax=Betta splendens TaxID=158456 RepID=A0A6P7L188_BETSP|nr:uncharacterized protein LOC114844880 isoform X2 [Betta splendens]
MNLVLQCVILLFLSFQYEASRAVTSVFVKKGHDVQLDVKEDDVPEDFSFFAWKFNGTKHLVSFVSAGKPRVSNLYTGRVEFLTYTVKLKNVQETDSGVYTAVFTEDKDQTAAIYSVTVQAPVSPVNLTVDSVSSSSDSCNLTVTCRTQDSHISTTFTCVNQTCSEDGDGSKATTSAADLRVYLENDSINCNHSNQRPKNHGAMLLYLFLCLLSSLLVCSLLYEEQKKENIHCGKHSVCSY